MPLRSPSWTRLPIRSIDELDNAVLGAGLAATQMSTGGMSGSLAFREDDGIVTTTGLIGGRVLLEGPLSQGLLSFGIGLNLPSGTMHWNQDVETGNVGVFRASDEHCALYLPGALYVVVSLTEDRLVEEAAHEELVLEPGVACATGVHSRNIAPELVRSLDVGLRRVHAGLGEDAGAASVVLRAAIRHLARPPYTRKFSSDPRLHGRMVRRARDYIMAHLSEPMGVADVAQAAGTSRRTLYRAFAEVLNETPQSYVRRVRLHRIRRDLATAKERKTTITIVANEWGISDLGRMAGWYRDLFGEKPSETVAKPLLQAPVGPLSVDKDLT